MFVKKIYSYFIILLSLMSVYAQDPLMDPEILKALRQIGVSPKQAEDYIKSKSLNTELPDPGSETLGKDFDDARKEKLDEQLEAIYELDKNVNSSIPTKINYEANEIVSPFLKDTVIKEIKEKTSEKIMESIENIDIKKEYFGYDIFELDPEIFQKSISESTNPDYQIGPGDEIIIMLWGETEFNKEYVVTKDGYMFIDNIGQVFVNGLTLEKLEKKLFRLLKKVYSSLDSKSTNASTFFDVSLGSTALRPQRVFVLGEVKQPGAYSVKPSTSLFSSLYYFRGPSINGSLRKIKLIRKEKEIAEIDFYEYLLTGKQFKDSRLQKDDVVFIPPRGKTIRVIGEINRQKYFELKENEGLLDLIDIAGGLKAETYMSRAQIKRVIPASKRSKGSIDRTYIDVNLNEILDSKDDFELFDGDEVSFFKISEETKNIVDIKGSIKRPGIYDLKKGMKLAEVIDKAEGLDGNTYLDRADIIRTNADKTKSLISVDLNKVLKNDKNENIQLKSNDEIKIYSLDEMVFKADVEISGHVKNPGTKEFLKDMKVYDLVFLGGGFKDQDHLNNTFKKRADLIRIKDNGLGKTIIPFRLDSVLAKKGIADIRLKMGDEIKVYSLSDVIGTTEGTVEITGNVKNPGEYPYYDNFMLKDLLFIAGGFDDKEHLATVFLERADIIRFADDFKTQDIIKFDIGKLFNGDIDDIKLNRNDKVIIYTNKMFGNMRTVRIEGAIFEPGEYDLKQNMQLRDILLEAGGVNTDIHRYRVEIGRIDPYNISEEKFAKIFTFDLTNSLDLYAANGKSFSNNAVHENFILMPYDVITVRPDPFFSVQKTVHIVGYVYYPGEYVIRAPTEKVTDIIERAGGLRPEAYPLASELIRDSAKIQLSFKEIIERPRSKKNFTIMEGDSIIIKSRPNVVTLIGEVNSPGDYQFIKGASIRDYINLGGGWTSNASKEAVFIKYPNGLSKKQYRFSLFSPRVLDGSVITVGEKGEVEPFNITEYVTNLTAIYTDLMQALLLIQVMGSN